MTTLQETDNAMDLEICERLQNNQENSGEKSDLNEDLRDKEQSLEIVVKTEDEEREDQRESINEDQYLSIQRKKNLEQLQQQKQIDFLSPLTDKSPQDLQRIHVKSTLDHLDPVLRVYLDRISNVSYRNFMNPIVEGSARMMFNWKSNSCLKQNDIRRSSKSMSRLQSQSKEEVLESKIQTQEILLDGKQKQINNNSLNYSEVRSEKRQLKEQSQFGESQDNLISSKVQNSLRRNQQEEGTKLITEHTKRIIIDGSGVHLDSSKISDGVDASRSEENSYDIQTEKPQKYPFNQQEQYSDERVQAYFQQQEAYSQENLSQRLQGNLPLVKRQQLIKKRSGDDLVESNSLAKIGRQLIMFLTDYRNLLLIQEIAGDDFTENEHDMFIDYCNQFRIRNKNDFVNLWEEQSIENEQYHLIIRLLSKVYLEKYCHCQVLGTSKPYKVNVDLKMRRQLLDILKRIK